MFIVAFAGKLYRKVPLPVPDGAPRIILEFEDATVKSKLQVFVLSLKSLNKRVPGIALKSCNDIILQGLYLYQ